MDGTPGQPDDEGIRPLLLHFLRNPGRVYTRLQLLDTVWVLRLRRLRAQRQLPHQPAAARKIERDPAHPSFILTLRGVGYRLVAA